MEMVLEMVGHFANKDVVIKGVPFRNGVGLVQGADELVGNVCKYLRTFGAFPVHEAERLRAEHDKAAGKAGDMRGTKARLARAKKEVAEAEAQLEEARMAAEERMQAEEEQHGTVQDHSTSEGRGSKPAKHSKNSKPSGNSRQ